MLEFNDIKDLLGVLTQYEILGLRKLGIIRCNFTESKHGISCLKTKYHRHPGILKFNSKNLTCQNLTSLASQASIHNNN